MSSSEEKLGTYVLKQFVTICILGGLMLWIEKCSDDSSAPKIASEVLKQQNIVNDKKQTFSEAIDISLRHISHAFLIQVNKDTMGTKPTALEENSCLVKLYIFCTNQDIPKQFKKILLVKNGGDAMVEYTKFLSQISKELGNENVLIDSTEFEFVLPSDSNIVKSP